MKQRSKTTKDSQGDVDDSLDDFDKEFGEQLVLEEDRHFRYAAGGRHTNEEFTGGSSSRSKAKGGGQGGRAQPAHQLDDSEVEELGEGEDLTQRIADLNRAADKDAMNKITRFVFSMMLHGVS